MSSVKGDSGSSGYTPAEYGVWGEASFGWGVVGSSAESAGVVGHGREWGVVGDTVDGAGVFASGLNNVGVFADSPNGTGVYATTAIGVGARVETTDPNNANPALHAISHGGVGVWADSTSSAGVYTNSVSGAGLYANSVNGHAVYAISGTGVAIAGVAQSSNTGVFGYSANGVGAEGYSETSTGVYGSTGSPAAYAAWFQGKVGVAGLLEKYGGSTFKIDHPLDPAHKYLAHSVVESPEMKNIYDGVAVTDGNGEAVVELPPWFEALNTDFRYQLTPIGAPAPALHIAQEVKTGQFTIAGAVGRMKISWQVTGVRHDAWAKVHPLAVEQDKAAGERNHYLHPELYGAPEERRIGPPRGAPQRPAVSSPPRPPGVPAVVRPPTLRGPTLPKTP